ncbi:MAG: winged helix-turn-helix transcriptional regulator [Thermoleophilaceae bacterium]
MATKRTYSDACGIPRALDRVGERWALMIVRELILGPKRFTDVRAALPGLSPDVLSQRLRDLEQSGIVERATLPPPAASHVYELTDWGRELESVLLALGRWGARAPAPPEGCGMSFDAHILSMKTLFDPELAGDFETSIDLRLCDQRFHAAVADGTLEIVRGEAPGADATVTTDAGTLIDVIHGRLDLDEALRGGAMEIAGDQAAVARFVSLFPLPEPALS